MPTGSFQQFVIGASLMIVAILSAVLVGWQGGILIDGFYNNSAGWIPKSVINTASANNNPVYNAMSGLGVEVYFVNLFWALDVFLGLLGVFLFWQGFVKFQSSDTYAGVGTYSGGSGGGGRGQRMRRRRNR